MKPRTGTAPPSSLLVLSSGAGAEHLSRCTRASLASPASCNPHAGQRGVSRAQFHRMHERLSPLLSPYATNTPVPHLLHPLPCTQQAAHRHRSSTHPHTCDPPLHIGSHRKRLSLISLPAIAYTPLLPSAPTCTATRSGVRASPPCACAATLAARRWRCTWRRAPGSSRPSWSSGRRGTSTARGWRRRASQTRGPWSSELRFGGERGTVPTFAAREGTW